MPNNTEDLYKILYGKVDYETYKKIMLSEITDIESVLASLYGVLSYGEFLTVLKLINKA